MYEGPYSILCQHKSRSYSLLDTMGEILPKKVQISQIKILEARIDTTVPEKTREKNKHFVINLLGYQTEFSLSLCFESGLSGGGAKYVNVNPELFCAFL